ALSGANAAAMTAITVNLRSQFMKTSRKNSIAGNARYTPHEYATHTHRYVPDPLPKISGKG
ncbi:MAG: hypothetical protein ACK5XO_12020, partial [Phycisphaerales bacterium]